MTGINVSVGAGGLVGDWGGGDTGAWVIPKQAMLLINKARIHNNIPNRRLVIMTTF